jgi:hypothetical protein
MKTMFEKLFAALFFVFVAAQSNAMAGRMSHGGDPLALEFTQAANSALAVLEASPATFPEIVGAHLDTVIAKAKVLISDAPLTVEENGVTQESVAVNYPSTQTVVINRSRWEAIATYDVKSAVALHEILGLKGIESTGVYTISQRYLQVTGTACDTGVCANLISASTFNVLSPGNTSNLSGVVQFRGQAGSEWVNVAIYDLFDNTRKVGLDTAPSDQAYSIPVDTSQLSNGYHKLAVSGFTVAPGILGGSTVSVYLEVNVQN